MKLDVGERLVLPQILEGQTGSFVTLGVIRETIANLALKDKEFKEFGIKQVDTQVTWNVKGGEGREIEIGEVVTGIIVKVLTEMEKAEKLEQRHYTLYEKFVRNQPK